MPVRVSCTLSALPAGATTRCCGVTSQKVAIQTSTIAAISSGFSPASSNATPDARAIRMAAVGNGLLSIMARP